MIVLHGFKGFMDWGFFPELSRQLAGAGFACLSFNVSGSGIGQKLADFTDEEGFAKNTFSLEVRDLGLVRDLVDSGALTGIDATRCGVLGHSRGGGVALLNAAARGDYQAIVTWASICHIARFDAATVASWKRIGHILIPNARTGQDQRMDLAALEDAEQNRAALDIEGASARVAAPTLVVHGTADGSVDVSEGERLVAALPAGELFRIEGSGHTFEARHPFAHRVDKIGTHSVLSVYEEVNDQHIRSVFCARMEKNLNITNTTAPSDHSWMQVVGKIDDLLTSLP